MKSNFIPNYHYTPPSQKMTADWCMKCVSDLWFNCNNLNLLQDKDVTEIDGYAAGDFDMRPFVKMFKSLRKDLVRNGKIDNSKDAIKRMDLGAKTGLEFEPLPLLPEKLNSATAVVSKIPVEVACNATDPLAIEKREKDVYFIKNKKSVEDELQDIYDRLGAGKLDLGSTENSAVEFSDSPFGLDLNEADELSIFLNLIYALKVEVSFETALQSFYELRNRKQSRLLEIKDQLRYGISTNAAFQSSVTDLPECEYVHPSEIETPFSLLPDYSDNTHRVRTKYVTPLELMNYFGSEIKNKEQLEEIINAKDTGYCPCNSMSTVRSSNFDTLKVTLKYFEVRTVDYVGVAKSKHKKGYTTLTEKADDSEEKIWAQNTYGFWWLCNTKHIFGIERLGFSHREKGKESIQNFSTNIYKSQERSAVELSIGENKKAQVADIKLQHAVIMSLPAGRYIDLRYLREAAKGLSDGINSETMDELIHLALERNIMLGDTEGFDGKNDGQFKPVIDLPGGLKSEIIGYLNIIAQANANISRITGINQQLTGQKVEELIGLQQISIESSINSLYYITEAIAAQDQKIFSRWANIIKQAVEEGGAAKDAIKALIGSKKVSIIDGLDDIRLHDIGVTVKVSQRQREREFFLAQLAKMEQLGQLTASDIFMVTNIDNPKEQYAFLAVKEQKWKKKQEELQAQQYEQQQALMAQQGQNMVAAKQAETEGDMKLAYANGTVQSQNLQLAAQLGTNATQLQAVIDSNHQRARSAEQKEKNIATLREKSNLEQQESLI